MSTTTTSETHETQSRESLAVRLRQAMSDAIYAVVQFAPRVKRLQQNHSTWLAIRVSVGILGAALVVLPLSLGNFLILPILGMALFLAAILLPPSPHEVSDEEVAREVGATVVVEGGDYQTSSVFGFPAKIFVAPEEIWVMDPMHRTMAVIPVAQIGSANAEETGGQWAFRICWSGGEALFAYDGMFAEHLAKLAQDTVRGVMKKKAAEEPPKARAAGA